MIKMGRKEPEKNMILFIRKKKKLNDYFFFK